MLKMAMAMMIILILEFWSFLQAPVTPNVGVTVIMNVGLVIWRYTFGHVSMDKRNWQAIGKYFIIVTRIWFKLALVITRKRHLVDGENELSSSTSASCRLLRGLHIQVRYISISKDIKGLIMIMFVMMLLMMIFWNYCLTLSGNASQVMCQLCNWPLRFLPSSKNNAWDKKLATPNEYENDYIGGLDWMDLWVGWSIEYLMVLIIIIILLGSNPRCFDRLLNTTSTFPSSTFPSSTFPPSTFPSSTSSTTSSPRFPTVRWHWLPSAKDQCCINTLIMITEMILIMIIVDGIDQQWKFAWICLQMKDLACYTHPLATSVSEATLASSTLTPSLRRFTTMKSILVKEIISSFLNILTQHCCQSVVFQGLGWFQLEARRLEEVVGVLVRALTRNFKQTKKSKRK